MLIDFQTIPIWVAEHAKLPQHMLGPLDGCDGADFCYCIESAMLEDIEWQESLEIAVDKALLIERKWFRIWFRKNGYGYFASIEPDTLYERLVLASRFRCIYRRLQKNGDLRKEFIRIMVRALDY